MSDAPEDVIDALARPLAAARDAELITVEVRGGGSRTRVRVVVDRKGGIDLGTCQAISRALAKELDEVDPLQGRYTLEVTSPGTDRPLVDQTDFDRIEGRLVRILTFGEEDGTGPVTAAAPDAVELTDKAGDTHRIAYDDIRKATQELPW